MDRIHNVLFPHHRAQRHPGSQTFGYRRDVRLHSELLHSKHGTGPPHAGLNFIGDEQDVVGVANRFEFSKIVLGRCDKSAFSLNGFDDDGGR